MKQKNRTKNLQKNKTMKTLVKYAAVFTVLLIMQSCIVSRSPNQPFFDNPYYNNGDAQFVSVNVPMWIAKPIIKKALREDGESEEVINLIKKVKDIKILTVQNGNRQMLADFTSQLSKKSFQDWMTVKKDGQLINFQAKQDGDIIKKLMITVNSGTELVFIDVLGKFSADDISRIINYSEKADLQKVVSR